MAAMSRKVHSFQFNVNRESNLLTTGGNKSKANPTATLDEYKASQKKISFLKGESERDNIYKNKKPAFRNKLN